MIVKTKNIKNITLEISAIITSFFLFSVFILSPAFYVFKGAFEPLSISLISRSKEWTLDNFRYIFSEGYHIYIINSFIVCFFSRRVFSDCIIVIAKIASGLPFLEKVVAVFQKRIPTFQLGSF